MRHACSFAVRQSCLLLFAVGCAAQCANVWLPGQSAGVMGPVRAATAWDPDGPGPAGALVVVGGTFTEAGAVWANNIAICDPATTSWSALGSGTNGTVHALAVLPNGHLVAGGAFTAAGGNPANRVARWDGATWAALGSGVPISWVAALTAAPNGDVFAGGPGGVWRWNGTSWTALGSPTGPNVYALATLPNGHIVAAGDTPTSTDVAQVALWNGSSWSLLGAGISSPLGTPRVFALATLPNGDVIAGGLFSAGTAQFVARWNGVSWLPMGSGMDSTVLALGRLPNGDVVAAGHFTVAGGLLANRVAKWNGTAWAPVGFGLTSSVYALAVLPSGHVVASGDRANGGIARWNGSAWGPLATGVGATVRALAGLPDGSVVAGGSFTSAGGANVHRIARWDGAAWSPLGSGWDPSGWVNAVAVDVNGDIVAGGGRQVARWDGASWWSLGFFGHGFSVDTVFALLPLPNGDLIVGGNFTSAHGAPASNIARWDGASWSALGSGINGDVAALARLPNGDLVASGDFSSAGGVPCSCIARWNGTSWASLGPGLGGRARSLAVLPNGDLVAGGQFFTAGNRVARWNGSSWSQLGGGLSFAPYCLTVLPDGDVIAGTLASGGSAPLARWNGSAWSTFVSVYSAYDYTAVYALASLANGDVVAGGEFSVVGSVIAGNVARLTTTCPATAVSSGAGCNGTVGPLVLSATTLPWVGSTYRYRCTGMTTNSLGFAVFGFTSPGTPLSAIHPAGGVGCSLLASTDAVVLLLPGAGQVSGQLNVPASVALVGVQLQNQVLSIELDSVGGISSIVGSNGITLTLGAF